VGSKEGFYRISSAVENLREGEGCDYLVRELEDGYGIDYRGRAVAFFPESTPPVGEPQDFRLKARFVMSLPQLPLSADLCDFSGKGRKHMTVLFESKLVIYEMLGSEVVEFAEYRLPAGYPVSVQCLPSGKKDIVLVNMVSGESASSLLLQIQNGTPVLMEEGIPFIMAVLDRDDPEGSFVGQRFESRNLWGEVRKLSIQNGKIVAGDELPVPPGFRVDSAVSHGELLLFVDEKGFLRVFRGQDLLFSAEDFGGSYTTVKLPETYEGEGKFTFNPRIVRLNIQGKPFFAVVKNITSPVHRFLDVTKFSEGEIRLLSVGREGRVRIRRVQGRKFEEAIQSLIPTDRGEILVLTGRRGTLPLQNTGDVFVVTVEPF